jgi:DNA-binding MarR family transcriptional regulator
MEEARYVTDEYEVAAALQVAIGLLVRRLRQVHMPGELTLAETWALKRLDSAGPATSSELARQDRISPQSMGVTLAVLEQRGLIERRRDPADGRRVVLSVTEAGHKLVHDRRGARAEQYATALRDGFTASERDQLLAAAPLLERLAEKL